jgi:uncharacterized membrane protein YjjB (DUF3815 family)
MWKRILRSVVTVVVSQVIPLIPGITEMIPAPYNLLSIPILQGIGKFVRIQYPDSANYVPF